MAITKPMLPPKAGYVERVDASGNHYYAPTPDTLAAQIEEQETQRLVEENKLLNAQVAALSEQNDFQEELIVELAGVVYA